MKNSFKLLLLLFSVTMFACDPMGDIYDELDDSNDGYVTSLEYTLNIDDYKAISNLALEDATTPAEQDAARQILADTALVEGYSIKYIPYILDDTYLGYGTNAIAEVSYTLSEEAVKADSVRSVTENYKMHFAKYWVFDPSVAYTMAKEDYLLVSNHVKNNPEILAYWEEDYDGFDSYYGVKPKYSNIDCVYYNRQKNGDQAIKDLYNSNSFTALEDLFMTRVEEALIVFLQEKEGSKAVMISNGVEKLYSVTALLYKDDRSKQNVTYIYRCTKEGATPEFEKVEGPIY